MEGCYVTCILGKDGGCYVTCILGIDGGLL